MRRAWKAGRNDFEGWLSSSHDGRAGRSRTGLPLVKVGDPVYCEPLAVALDKSGPDPTDFIAKVNRILHRHACRRDAQGFSEKWFGLDLTEEPAD